LLLLCVDGDGHVDIRSVVFHLIDQAIERGVEVAVAYAHLGADGKLVSMDMGLPKSIFTVMIDAVIRGKLPLEKAVTVVTSNAASILKLKDKGRIEPGKDADIVILDKDYAISDLIARGQLMTHNYQRLKKGTYE
jgi:N-acetylglucosamine-6-phosphate deacetylase